MTEAHFDLIIEEVKMKKFIRNHFDSHFCEEAFPKSDSIDWISSDQIAWPEDMF